MDALVEQPVGSRVNLAFERLHEGVAAGRQDELESVVTAASKTGGKAVGAISELGNRGTDTLRGIGVDA
jgi:hypothetical protein